MNAGIDLAVEEIFRVESKYNWFSLTLSLHEYVSTQQDSAQIPRRIDLGLYKRIFMNTLL